MYCPVKRASQLYTLDLTPLLEVQGNRTGIRSKAIIWSVDIQKNGQNKTGVAKTFSAKYLDVSHERHCCSGTRNHSNMKRAESQGKGTSVANPTHENLLPWFHSHSCKILVFHSSLLWAPSQPYPSGRRCFAEKPW